MSNIVNNPYSEIEQTIPLDIGDRLAVEYLLGKLSAEEQEILLLYHVQELTFSEIGKVVGLKYRQRELTGSAIRYHHEKIKQKLQKFKDDLGL
jgi:DNA-directed RNA polymerase specialized sigma24 family protein